MSLSVHLLMTLLTEGQASGEITANECLKILDALCLNKAIDRTNTVPGSPVEGNAYLTGPSPTGAWTGQANKITVYMSGAWRFITPEEGWVVWARDTTSTASKTFWRYDGAAWIEHFAPLNVPNSQRIFQSSLPAHATGFLLVSGTSYFVYLGRAMQEVNPRPKFVEFHVSTAGAGAQTAEVGLFSSTSAPNKGNLSLTKIVSTGTVDSLIGTGVKRNTSSFSTAIPFNTHLWAGIRTAMATTQPTIESLCRDMAQGNVQSAAASGALTGGGPFSGTIIAAATGQIAPDLRVTLD